MRKPELTQRDIEILYAIRRYRGYLTSWFVDDGLYGSYKYTTKRLMNLRQRKLIERRDVKNKRWPRGVCWYLLKTGIETLNHSGRIRPIDPEIEEGRWKRWRNDELYAQWHRLYAAAVGREAEKEGGCIWLPKYKLIGHDKLTEDTPSTLSGGLLYIDETYNLYIILERHAPIQKIRSNAKDILEHTRSDGSVFLFLDESDLLEWGDPDEGEYVALYDWGKEVLAKDPDWQDTFLSNYPVSIQNIQYKLELSL